MRKEGMYPKSFKDCFHMDKDDINPIPRGILRKLYALSTSSRYSIPVFMRLSQFFYSKRESSNKIGKIFYTILSNHYKRKNQSLNNAEVPCSTCYIMGGGSIPPYGSLYNKWYSYRRRCSSL